MTLLTERPASTETAPETAAAPTAIGTTPAGGSYVTLPADSARDLPEGAYVTVAGRRNLSPASRGNYVMGAGIPAGPVGGRYVTLSKAA